MVKFTCNELYINSLEYNIGLVDRVSDDLTFRAILLVWSSKWTFSFWASLRRTLTSFCALHGRFLNPGALEQS